jgi:hypothetical protein
MKIGLSENWIAKAFRSTLFWSWTHFYNFLQHLDKKKETLVKS